jgi:hypothetical protein
MNECRSSSLWAKSERLEYERASENSKLAARRKVGSRGGGNRNKEVKVQAGNDDESRSPDDLDIIGLSGIDYQLLHTLRKASLWFVKRIHRDLST